MPFSTPSVQYPLSLKPLANQVLQLSVAHSPINLPANFCMDTSNFSEAIGTPTEPKPSDSGRSKSIDKPNFSENVDPNLSSPGLKLYRSPVIVKSGNGAPKLGSVKANVVATSPMKKKIRQRKFVIAKKKGRNEGADVSSACEKCGRETGKSRCLCVAYESLRASQEEFFRNQDKEIDSGEVRECDAGPSSEEACERIEALTESSGGSGESGSKRSRDRLLEEASTSIPEPGSGRVMHLVKAFERLRVIPNSGCSEEKKSEEMADDKKAIKWPLPGLQQPFKFSEMQGASSLFCSPDFFLTYESLGLDTSRTHSLDSSQKSISVRTSIGGHKSRTSSAESSETLARREWKRKKQRATSQKPFMLRTEQRGKMKEEELEKKLQQMIEEDEKLRIPVAQGLPWTTDEPEMLVKPQVKEITRPVDQVLHTDIRAVERAEFDNQVAKKMSIYEEYRIERERRQKLEEEEEIRRLRKELVPKAQPMPYFDNPFVPRRSIKNPSTPKEPKLSLPQHKKIKCYTSSIDSKSTD